MPYERLRPDRRDDEQQFWGRYIGKVIAKWNEDGRTMTLDEDFAYEDPSRITWHAPRHSVVDGASIPMLMWSVIGGPFEGLYRDASVVHDVACVTRNREWQLVHRAFYNAMRTSGVSALRAKLMYAAVYHFGPRWIIKEGVAVQLRLPLMTNEDLTYLEGKLTLYEPPPKTQFFDPNSPYHGEVDILELDLKGIEELTPPSRATCTEE